MKRESQTCQILIFYLFFQPVVSRRQAERDSGHGPRFSRPSGSSDESRGEAGDDLQTDLDVPAEDEWPRWSFWEHLQVKKNIFLIWNYKF